MRKLLVLALVGLVAQLVDGSLGMAYGVTSSTLLLATGIAPAAASAAVHFSEIGTTLVSGFSHHKLGNVDWRMVGIMAVPGGHRRLRRRDVPVEHPRRHGEAWVAGLLLALGVYVIWRFLALGGRRPPFQGRLPAVFLAPLGVVAGLMDADRRRRLGPGGHHLAALLGSARAPQGRRLDRHLRVRGRGRRLAGLPVRARQPGHQLRATPPRCWSAVCIAAPFAAWLVRYLPSRVLGVAAGGLIVLTNIDTIVKASAPRRHGRAAGLGRLR